MEVSYQRDFNHNYMVMEKEEISGEEYMIRMIEQNHIPELLKLQVRKINGKTYLYYEITSRQPLSRVYEARNMKHKDIERLLMGIRDGLNRARQYLLNNGDILLDPEYIYMDVDTRQIQLCYVPYSGQENQSSFLNLAEFILKKLDHGERQAVELGYELFHQASKESFGFSEIVQLLLREKTNRGQAGRMKDHFCQESVLSETEMEERIFPNPSDIKGKPDKPREGEEKREAQKKAKTAIFRPDKVNEKKCGTPKKIKDAGRICDGKNTERKKGWIIGSLAAAGMLLIFGVIVYFARLDLTQTGGLAFLLLALVWIAAQTAAGKRSRKRKEWVEEDFGEEEEEQLLETVFSEKDGVIEAADELNELDGETQCLTEAEKGKSFRLASLEADKYGDIILNQEKMLVGKKKEQVDIWLSDASISRIHARLEQNQEDCFVTDLNSMNGTYVGRERLMPNEKRKLSEGDKISFAARHYRVKVREF